MSGTRFLGFPAGLPEWPADIFLFASPAGSAPIEGASPAMPVTAALAPPPADEAGGNPPAPTPPEFSHPSRDGAAPPTAETPRPEPMPGGPEPATPAAAPPPSALSSQTPPAPLAAPLPEPPPSGRSAAWTPSEPLPSPAPGTPPETDPGAFYAALAKLVPQIEPHWDPVLSVLRWVTTGDGSEPVRTTPIPPPADVPAPPAGPMTPMIAPPPPGADLALIA